MHTIMVGGVAGYRKGDDVPAAAVENLKLVVGTDVMPADRNIVPRPARSAARGEWEAYALGQGMDLDKAHDMSRDQLRDAYPDQVRDDVMPLPPAAAALKADWVDYAVVRGLPRAEAEVLTKDDLMGQFGPKGDG